MSAQRSEEVSQRVFDALHYVKEGAERTLQKAYEDRDISAFVEWVEPGRVFGAPHKHPESAHIFVILAGEGEALVGPGRWERVRAGQFIVCPRNKIHNVVRNTGSTRMVWVAVDVNSGPYVSVAATEDGE